MVRFMEVILANLNMHSKLYMNVCIKLKSN